MDVRMADNVLLWQGQAVDAPKLCGHYQKPHHPRHWSRRATGGQGHSYTAAIQLHDQSRAVREDRQERRRRAAQGVQRGLKTGNHSGQSM